MSGAHPGLRVDIYVRRADGSALPPFDKSALPLEDHERASRFRSAQDATLWQEARFLLRTVLARHTGVAPARLALRAGPFGKPILDGGPRFNLSHGGTCAMLAVLEDRKADVGLDVEPLCRNVAADLQRATTGPEEAAWLASLPEHDRNTAFLALWTGKESVLKAAGTGLALAPAMIVLDPPRHGLRRVPAAIGPANDYSLHALSAPHGHVATLAVRDGLRRPVCITQHAA